MDFGNIKVMSALKNKMAYLGQRQAVVAENIANANTPKYKAKDVKRGDFFKLVNVSQGANLKTTSNRHIKANSAGSTYEVFKVEDSFETKPDSNNVVLEEQAIKISEISVEYNETINLLRKMSEMVRIALGNSN